MDSHSFLNPVVQTIAAFLIFVTGFVALFVLVLACVTVVCFLYWATNRLAVLLADLRKRESILGSMDPVSPPAPAPRSPASRGLTQAI
jgi:hypothetical protein